MAQGERVRVRVTHEGSKERQFAGSRTLGLSGLLVGVFTLISCAGATSPGATNPPTTPAASSSARATERSSLPPTLPPTPTPTQPAAPTPPPSPEPTATAGSTGQAWVPARFVGGAADVLTVTSDCGIPGVDTFHLTGVGPSVTAVFDVTLTDYDAANLRWTGREVGHVYAPNSTVYNVDDEASMYYDLNQGMWFLKGTWIDKAPLEAC